MQKPREKFRFCATKTCLLPFRVGRSMRYCDKCYDERTKKRREAKKLRRQILGKYPKGFGKARQQLELDKSQCAICLINQADHLKAHGDELSVHHVIMAKFAAQFGDPHAAYNLVELCVPCHAKLKSADEALLRGDWLSWVQESRAAGLPDQILKNALDGFGVGWGRLPL